MKEMSKEEIYRWAILNTAVTDDLLESGQNAVYSAMDVWGKQETIGFIKWYALRMVGLIQHLRNRLPALSSRAIDVRLSEFEGQSFEQLYNLYLEDKNKKQ